MKKLTFSNNWNRAKLNCLSFSTIRLSTAYKVGDKVEIHLKGQFLGVAEVIQSITFLLEQLTPGMAYLDTGYGKKETQDIIKKMYPNIKSWDSQPIYWLLCRYIDVKQDSTNEPANINGL